MQASSVATAARLDTGGAVGPRSLEPKTGATELASTQWFAAYTASHHEKRAAALLAERGMESFLPLYAALRRWRNRSA